MRAWVIAGALSTLVFSAGVAGISTDPYRDQARRSLVRPRRLVGQTPPKARGDARS